MAFHLLSHTRLVNYKDISLRPSTDNTVSIRSLGVEHSIYTYLGYHVVRDNSSEYHVIDYRDANGMTVASKVTYSDDSVTWYGNRKEGALFGTPLNACKSDIYVIVEHEHDALAIFDIFNRDINVICVPNGFIDVDIFALEIKPFVSNNNSIITMFSNTREARQAARIFRDIFTGSVNRIRNCIKPPYNTSTNNSLYVDAVKDFVFPSFSNNLHDSLIAPQARMLVNNPINNADCSWPFIGLNNFLKGKRTGQIIVLAGGTGVGKTELLTDIIKHDIIHNNLRAACYMLESTEQSFFSKLAGKFSNVNLQKYPDKLQDPLIRERFTQQSRNHVLFTYNSTMRRDWTSVRESMAYAVSVYGVNCFYIDNMSVFLAYSKNDRKMIDEIMGSLVDFAKTRDVMIHIVSQLTTPIGRPHEEGGPVSANQLTGSRTISQYADTILALERNTLAENRDKRRNAKLTILKDREHGTGTGEYINLYYDNDIGSYKQIDNEKNT
ncbi:MAG: DnaB-like helicase C-terminal domain-containing protein [Candidatus Thiodiazotropha endolucinida]